MDDLLKRLPSRQEVGCELATVSQRARRLRSLYRLIAKFDREASDENNSSSPGGGVDVAAASKGN